MDNKNVLIKIVIIIVCAFGYFYLSFLHIDFKIIFCIIGILAALVYLIESIKNKSGKVNIDISVLSCLLFTALLSHFIIIYKFPEYDSYQNYILFFTVIVILLACKIGGSDYNKIASKKEKKFTKVLLIIVIICIALIIVLLILKRYAAIP